MNSISPRGKFVTVNVTDGISTLVQVMAWWCQASNHYLCQWRIISMVPYEITSLKGNITSNNIITFIILLNKIISNNMGPLPHPPLHLSWSKRWKILVSSSTILILIILLIIIILNPPSSAQIVQNCTSHYHLASCCWGQLDGPCGFVQTPAISNM